MDRAMPSVEPKHERAYAMCRRTKTTQYAPVAQMDRAIASDAMCRWFDSSRVYQTPPVTQSVTGGVSILTVVRNRIVHN